jgi:hypothetical protein
MIVSFAIQLVYAYDIATPTVYSNGYAIFQNGSRLYRASLDVEDEYGLISLDVWDMNESFSWIVNATVIFSIDIRDRPYIPIDLLVAWNKSYIINYTQIHGTDSILGILDDIVIQYNDVWDGITLYSQGGLYYIGNIGDFVILEE